MVRKHKSSWTSLRLIDCMCIVDKDLLKISVRYLYVPQWGNSHKDIIQDMRTFSCKCVMILSSIWRLTLRVKKIRENNVGQSNYFRPYPFLRGHESRSQWTLLLSYVDGCVNIMVVNRFSKYDIFILIPSSFNVDDVATLFFKHMVKHYGLSRSIISDWDARFTRRFGRGCSSSWGLIWTSLLVFIHRRMERRSK